MENRFIKFFKNAFSAHKILTAIISLVLVLIIATTTAVAISAGKTEEKDASSLISRDEISSASSEITSSEPVSSTESLASSEPVVSSKPQAVSKVESTVSKAPVKKPVTNKKPVTTPVKKPVTVKPATDYKYNTNADIDNNIFLDSLVYTGYNLKKHRADGLMWQYVLASQKRGKGWLSKIGYAGGCTGYETIKGKPNIKAFEKGGLVCASYVTYVYFNYLPNVAGIDTSSLTKPKKSYSANDWYIAASDWVKKGYSKSVGFTASKTSAGFIKFKLKEDIPIGSIMAFSDAKKPGSKHCSHVAIYAGYKNGYHWVFHVGNDNGPEFCAVERMHFGPDPQWPLAVITTPSNIRMSALLEITAKDNNGTALSGVKYSIKNTKTGKAKYLGATNKNGKLTVENLTYGEYVIIETVPSGYTCAKPSVNVKLTTANNSYNKVTFVNNLIPPPEPEIPSSSVPSVPQNPSEEQGGNNDSTSSDVNSGTTTEQANTTE